MMFTEPIWKSLIVTTNRPMFTPEQCQLIIKKGLSLKPEKGITGSPPQGPITSEAERQKKVPDENLRKSTVRWIDFKEMPDMYKEIGQTVGRANNNHFGYEGLTMVEPAQFTEYKSDGEHYGWHMDSDTLGRHEPPIRKISMTVPLVPETDFEGGQMEFNKPGDKIHLKQGQAVFFASFLQHRILPVTKGTRYSLVQWFTGPSFK